MNKDKKNSNEILEDEAKSNIVDIEESASNSNNKEIKKKKEHSNTFKVFRLLLVFIVFILAFTYFSGSWNPFKSSEISKEATTLYEKSEETAKNIFEIGKEIKEKTDGVKYGVPDSYSPSGERPYGFKIQDFGKEGNNQGVQKEMESVSWEVSDNFGSDLKIYYMINEDYAKEKYKSLQNAFPAPYDEFSFNGGKIAFGETYESVGAYIVVLKGTVVYKFLPKTNEDYKKSEGFMDLLGIDFEFPAHEDLWQGKLNQKKTS